MLSVPMHVGRSATVSKTNVWVCPCLHIVECMLKVGLKTDIRRSVYLMALCYATVSKTKVCACPSLHIAEWMFTVC